MVKNRTTYIALVTFERAGETATYLLPEEQGACGYQAISAIDEDDLRNALSQELAEVGLRLVAIDDTREIEVDNLPDDIDDHLAENIRNWEPGKRTVWGTIYTYIGDGEA